MFRSCCIPVLFFFAATSGFGQTLINRSVLSGNGSDQPQVIATGSDGSIYVAGNTTSSNFPVTNALEPQPPVGALQVSINGGSFVNSGLQANGVTAVAASSDGSLVIASTGSGIFRSTNAGATWTAAATVLPAVSALAVDPVNSSNAYALLTLNGALYKSADGGVTWRNTGASLPVPGATAAIFINPQTPSTLYLWDSYAVYRSMDSGQSWQLFPIQNSSISAFALAPSQPSILYATGNAPFGPVFQSTDGGATWTQGANNIFAYSPAALAVDPSNPSTLWLVDNGLDVRKSTDGGKTFQTVTTVSASAGGLTSVAIDPANPARVYAGATSLILETADGGQTWSTTSQVYFTSLYAAPSRVYTVGGLMPQTVFLAKFDATLSQPIYVTYLWPGSVSGIAVDSSGDVYLAGSDVTGSNGVVMKVSAADNSVVYSTALAGAVAHAIAIDSDGNATIAGTASSLAVTMGAYQSSVPGPCPRPIDPTLAYFTQELTHAFVGKLNTNGALVNASYLTGSCGDTAYTVSLDSSGAIYVGGETYSPDFPVSSNAMTGQFPSTYSAGFLSKLSPALDKVLYSTFLGGGYFTAVHAMTFDGAGTVYLAGSTLASPTPGASHATTPSSCPQGIGIGGPHPTPPPPGDNPFIMKMTLSSAPPAFLAVVGGACQGEADSVALDAAGNIWLAGSNRSWGFPSVAPVGGLGQIPPQDLGYIGVLTGFLTELNPSGTTVLDSTVTDAFGTVTADSTAVYYAGGLGDLNASVVPTGNYAAVVAEIAPAQTAPIFIDRITQYTPLSPTNTLLSSAVAPGEIVRIFGRGIGPQDGAGAKLTPGGTLATSLGGVTVTFNGIPAPLLGADTSQVIAIAPFELTGLTSATVQVQYNGLTSNTYTVTVVPQNPDVLAVVNGDWTPNSATNPSHGLVMIYLTGLGQTVPASIDGAINQLPLAKPAIIPEINYSGDANGYTAYLGAAAYSVAGVYQLNVVASGSVVPVVGQALGLEVEIGSASLTVYVQ